MVLATLPKSSPPYDFQFAASETHKTHSGDISHHVEHLQKSTSDYNLNQAFYVGGMILATLNTSVSIP